MAGLVILLPLCYFVAVAVASGLQLPNVYHVTGTIYLPNAEVAEPFEAWVDFNKGMSRIDYYNGVAQFINRGDISQYGATFMIIFETTKEYTNQRTCIGGNGTSDFKVTPQGVFPDMSNYTLTNATSTYKGIKCDEYYYEFQENTKWNKYIMLVNPATGMPVLLTFVGYDNVFGSHYDQYVFEYDKIETSIDYSVFSIYQTMSCNPFPDASLAHVMYANPAFELIGSPDHDRSVQTAQLDKQFEEFKKKHGKDYGDAKEHEQRKANFRNNYRFINSNNRRALTYSLAINHLTDLSNDELKMMRGYRHTKGAKGGIEFTSDVDVSLIPNDWDWRIHGAVSPIKDQGICGSCWSFGTTGTIEGAYFLKNKMMVTMSEQALVDCSWGYYNFGCDGGDTINAYQWIMDNGCIPTEDSYGAYLQQDGYCHNQAAQCGAVLSNYSTIPSGDLDSLRVAVATKGPIAVAIDASHKSFSFYDFGVYYEPNCGNKADDLDHSVLAIGYGTQKGEDYWLIKNSWSPLWGNQGYVLMSRKDNNCGVATQADYAIMK